METHDELILSDSFIPPIVACLAELAHGTAAANLACEADNININSEFERRAAIAFELLGLSVERLGQGAGRKPDGIAKCFEDHWAIVYDAKVRSSGYRLLVDDERKFREYIERNGNSLRDQGIERYYFAVISSGYANQDIAKARELCRTTQAKAFIFVEADELLQLIERRLREPRKFTMAHLESKFIDTGILTAYDLDRKTEKVR